MPSGASIVCETLEALGGRVVFGMAGSQNVAFFDALRASSLRTVTTTNEMAAGFAANGYARASGEVGLVTTIPGPGFTFALSAIAESRLDSAPLLYLVPSSGDGSGRPFQHQFIDQPAIARALAKDVLIVTEVSELAGTVAHGYKLAAADEPGPVMVIVDGAVLRAAGRSGTLGRSPASPIDQASVEVVADALTHARRVALLVGQGGQTAAARIRELAESLDAVVLTTSSGRGVISEDDERSLYFDYTLGGGTTINRFLEGCDLVLALGCKLTHNGTGGFQLRLPPDRLIHVDSASTTLRGRYPAATAVKAEVGAFVDALVGRVERRAGAWAAGEIDRWRADVRVEQRARLRVAPPVLVEPPISCATFFETLQKVLPEEAIVVTDTGFHQGLARGHLRIKSARGFIAPADFQSMGFGLPAAIGAKIAAPSRPVVLVIGDGGMSISGLEMLTAVREGLDLGVVVLNDGYLGLIRLQQLQTVGRSFGVSVRNPDFSLLAASVGAKYWRLQADLEGTIRAWQSSPGVSVLEVALGEPPGLERQRLIGRARRLARRATLRR